MSKDAYFIALLLSSYLVGSRAESVGCRSSVFTISRNRNANSNMASADE